VTTSATLGRYEILRELGHGAMGRVFLAHDPQIDRNVAIKTVQYLGALPEHEQLESRERFLREARAVGRLAHPCIVTLYDVDELEGVLYLVMEYVEGPTLDNFCHRDRLLPVSVVAELVACAAEALHDAHRAGVVHRDIKPTNLIRVGEASLKIADFGLAKGVETQLTHDGALLGTPSYMSPEQVRGQTVDGRSDLFSLGVVLFELLTGDRPFPGESVSSIIYRIVHDPPRALERREPLAPALCEFVTRALAKNPAERFATGEEFSRELRRATTGTGSRATAVRGPAAELPLSPPVVRTVASARAGPRWIVGALVVIGVALGVAYALREPLGFAAPAAPPEVWWETQVRTEPPGLEVMLDGRPIGPGPLRFSSNRPLGLLTARQACRSAEHRLDAADAGGEVVLVLDPTELAATVDPGIAAELRVNGKPVGVTPTTVSLDLCQDNQLELRAAGHQPRLVAIPAGSSPLAARNLMAATDLEPLARGTLVLPAIAPEVAIYVDGKRLRAPAREIELDEGTHDIRLRNDDQWIDVHESVAVVGGQSARSEISAPALATLAVQAFPANCQVYLRRPGGEWKYLDDTPMAQRVAAGRYEVRVESIPTGEKRQRQIDLVAGENPPVRVSFAGP
jgi:hypothetical protein